MYEKWGSSLAAQHLLLAAGDHPHLLSSVEEGFVVGDEGLRHRYEGD
jgi:hypothetical protein